MLLQYITIIFYHRLIINGHVRKFPVNWGMAKITIWSKALPLTASCLAPLPGFESACEKVAIDLNLGGGFRPPPLTSG